MRRSIMTKTLCACSAADTMTRRVVALALTSVLLLVGAPAGAAGSPGATEGAPAAAEEARPDDVLIRLGDEVVTREEFEREFEVAARATALQQGMPLTSEVLAQFDAFRPAFLDQLARQLVLVRYAAEEGIAVEPADVDDVVENVRAAQLDDAAFGEYLETAGFADEAEFRATIERSLTMQQVVARLMAAIDVSDGEVEAWYEANPDLVETPEGPLPLDAIRDEIAALIAQERLEERVEALVVEAPLEVFAERL
jgi:hypothetical protein